MLYKCKICSHLFSAGSLDCLRLLLGCSAKVDEIDVKAQTPLFVAVVNQHWECARYSGDLNTGLVWYSISLFPKELGI
jgi:hypothetical protein